MHRSLCRRALALLLSTAVLAFPAATATAGSGTPAAIANSEGIAVALSNFTPYMLTRTGLYENASIGGPGYPVGIWPYQHTGTNVTMRGGPASGGESEVTYAIETNEAFDPAFTLRFTANTEWDFEAAASLLLHTAKKKATKKAKAELKKAAKEGAEAAGAADGMTEVIAVYKLIKLFAKLFGALDPTFVMNIAIEADTNTGLYENSCITKSQNTPGPAVVQIIGPPGETITSENVDSFYVVSAGSSNKYEPGFVDLGVNSLCGYVCAAWNSTLDELNETSQSDCEDAGVSGSTAQSNYDEILDQNICLAEASAADGTPWVSVDFNGPSYNRYSPQFDSCDSTGLFGYFTQVGICGDCPPIEASEALGSWSESCDEVSHVGDVLTANCATNTNPNRVSQSSLECATGHWDNDGGELACGDPPGSWIDSCTFLSFSGTTLCASCRTPEGNYIDSCQPCASDEWYNVDGELLCAPPPETQTAGLPAVPPTPPASLRKYPPDPGALSPSFALAAHPSFDPLTLGADR